MKSTQKSFWLNLVTPLDSQIVKPHNPTSIQNKCRDTQFEDGRLLSSQCKGK